MERKRGGLLPIGEAFGGLDGLVQAVRDASPQARDHYRLVDQVDALVRASETDPETGFMARWLMLCSLPRSNPGQRKEYVRRNGPYTLVMTAGASVQAPIWGTCPDCSRRGCAPKRSGRKAACWSWVTRSPGSCGNWISIAAVGQHTPGYRIR